MSWWSDAFDGVFDVEQDLYLEEDFEETESPPVQKKMKKNTSKRCRQAEEKPRVQYVLNKAKKKHMITHIATICRRVYRPIDTNLQGVSSLESINCLWKYTRNY